MLSVGCAVSFSEVVVELVMPHGSVLNTSVMSPPHPDISLLSNSGHCVCLPMCVRGFVCVCVSELSLLPSAGMHPAPNNTRSDLSFILSIHHPEDL